MKVTEEHHIHRESATATVVKKKIFVSAGN
jgi:hypothetical protein